MHVRPPATVGEHLVIPFPPRLLQSKRADHVAIQISKTPNTITGFPDEIIRGTGEISDGAIVIIFLGEAGTDGALMQNLGACMTSSARLPTHSAHGVTRN